jgi:benzoyl-CoA reductase subunit B
MNIPQRIELLKKCIVDYEADGYITNSIKSCNSFSAGQLGMMREIEDSLEVPVGFIESDLVDPRYFSYSNIKNRLESYFQMLEQRKKMETESV